MPYFPQSSCSIAFLLRHVHESKFLGFLKHKQVKVSDKKEQRFSCIVAPFLSSSSKLIVQFCLNSVRLAIVNSLVSSISCTRQSNLFMHSLRTEKISVHVFQDNTVFINEVFANGRRLVSVFNHTLVQVPESIAQQYVTCITQVTLKFINCTLLAVQCHAHLAIAGKTG